MAGKTKKYDLEERTFQFASDCRALVKKLPNKIANREDGRQLIKSSGSTGANYIEANESLSKKDFKFRIRICRKEAKESRYWLRLLRVPENKDHEKELDRLIEEATELIKIFSSILKNSK